MHHAFHSHAAHYASTYGHHSSGLAGGIGRMIMHGIIYSAISHMLSPIFRGHDIVGSIIIGVLMIGAVYLVAKLFGRRFA